MAEALEIDIGDASEALTAAHYGSLPTIALGHRLSRDINVMVWVDELSELDGAERDARIGELVVGAPRGVGRRVLTELLSRAAVSGRSAFLAAGASAAMEDAQPVPHDPKRAPKAGPKHDRRLRLALAADQIVRELVAYPRPATPTNNPAVSRRECQRLLQEVGAHILREDRPVSPSRKRRLGSPSRA